MPGLKMLLTDIAWPDSAIESELCNSAGVELTIAPDTDEKTLIQHASNADAIVTCWAHVTQAVIAATAGRCKVVTRMGIGLDNIDVDYCSAHQIPVTNVPDYCLQEVAEHTLASIFTLGRQLATFHQRTKQGNYQRDVSPPIRRIQGQTLGIVGLGNIGQRVAALAQSVGLHVVGNRRDMNKPVPGVTLLPLQELLAVSDYISLHLPLTDGNQHMISDSEFALMKKTAFLINTARGGLVNHKALATALQQNIIAGAALDVQDPEPPDLSMPPFNDPRVIISPHAAFVSEESLYDLRYRSIENTLNILLGNSGTNIVNQHAL